MNNYIMNAYEVKRTWQYVLLWHAKIFILIYFSIKILQNLGLHEKKPKLKELFLLKIIVIIYIRWFYE